MRRALARASILGGVLGLAVALTGCPEPPERKDERSRQEKVGDKVENGADRAGDKIENAGDKIEQRIDDRSERREERKEERNDRKEQRNE